MIKLVRCQAGMRPLGKDIEELRAIVGVTA
jgi:hypothetical protein